MVFVLSNDRQPLDPCHPARARQLLKKGKAAVFRRFPFTIILKYRSAAESQTHVHRLKLDPGSKTTGIAVVREADGQVAWAAVNSTRWALYQALVALELPVEAGTGGRTKFNRTRLGLSKAHWTDAACVGASTPDTLDVRDVRPLLIRATGLVRGRCAG